MSYPPPRAQSPLSRGRGASPRPPPSYARSSLDRLSPSLGPRNLEDELRPGVPPPIYLRRSGTQTISGKGVLKIHVPGWACVLLRPPRLLDLHPLDSNNGERIPPSNDTVLTGVFRVWRACTWGKEEDGRKMGYLRGVWRYWEGMKKASGLKRALNRKFMFQCFGFTIILPATLATTDMHNFGRVSYIITACVRGIPSLSSSFSTILKSTSYLSSEIPFVADFERVISRSDKAEAKARARTGSESASGGERSRSRAGSGSGFLGRERSGSGNTLESPDDLYVQRMSLGYSSGEGEEESTVIAVGTKTPCTGGLYTRRQSSDHTMPLPTPARSNSSSSPSSLDRFRSSSPSQPSEKTGWMKGDLVASKSMCLHAISPVTGGVVPLNLRREGFADGMGIWKFKAVADVFSISSVFLLSYNVPAPSPSTTIFLFRLILAQSYSVVSPRTPNDPPHVPEPPKQHVLYQIGRVHKSTESHPEVGVDCLWRGKEVSDKEKKKEGMEGEESWTVKAVARMPNHDKIRPTTNEGTITPIRVSHELIIQVYYSVHGEDVKGRPIKGAGELRMMRTKIPLRVPSCHCLSDSLSLPAYSSSSPPDGTPVTAPSLPQPTCHFGPVSSVPSGHQSAQEIDSIISSPPDLRRYCMCGKTFAELGESMLRGMRPEDESEHELNGRNGERTGGLEEGAKVGERTEEVDRSL
ncbi:hypothetical protein B9479_006794 [Cryptococcus floricola]|uniref:Uncharacterized protein n=1 Tax=Cryptococcus floricola TaxID=2591691 RepID=A0A5D3AS63_9TREE|nr:hypothetical protein B9479_006794 [Cryptococcus floricola]